MKRHGEWPSYQISNRSVHLSGRGDLTYWKSEDYDAALQKCREDDARRARDFYDDISASIGAGGGWLDFGTGLGGVAHEFLTLRPRRSPADFKGDHTEAGDTKEKEEEQAEERRRDVIRTAESAETAATSAMGRIGVLEVQKGALEALHRHLAPKGVQVYREMAEIPAQTPFQLVTLFHVFEHLDRPIETLQGIREKMTQGGKLIVEGELKGGGGTPMVV